jgi:phosphatidylserine/phosphatidylglycerophosphate/cardiolipin synthase-like enzyme
MFGKPGDLKRGKGTAVAVKTETPEGEPHSIYFNRAAISSQAYVKRFGLVNPLKIGEEALDWLTRELLPGLISFIERANNSSFSLHAAIYEAHLDEPLKALSDARKRKAKVHLIYGAKPKDGITRQNNKAIKDANLKGIAIPRKKAKLAHNKFTVLSRNDKPIAVWTGSTNWSTNAVYGQLNVVHAIEDADLAQQYLAYCNQLKDDPDVDSEKEWIDENKPVMALGSDIKVPTIDGWIKERGGIGTHVNRVHTKFMLVDPLGDTPVVVTGSANWSLSSINANDENLVSSRAASVSLISTSASSRASSPTTAFAKRSRFIWNGTARSTTGHRRIWSTSLANGCPALQEGKRVRTPTSLFPRRVTQHINVSRNDVRTR